MEEQLLSPKQAARFLGVSERRVLQYIKEGRLEAEKVAHVHVIRPEAIAKFNRENPRKPGRPWPKKEGRR